MSKVVLKCGKLFDSVSETVKEKVNVVVDGNKIVKVTTDPVDEKDCKVVDLSDKFVTPGLIDAHVHTMSNGEASFSGDLLTKLDGDYFVDSMLNAQGSLLGGFTTLRDEGSVGFVDISLRNAINAGKVWGPRMVVSGSPVGSTGGHSDNPYRPGNDVKGMSTIADGPDAARFGARYTFKYGADQVKLMATGGVMSVGDEPGAPDLTEEEMKAAIDIARTHGKLSSAHAHGALGIKYAIRAGVTSIEHGMLMDEECMDMMVEHGVYLIPTIIAAYRIVEHGSRLPAEAVRKAAQCLENHGTNLEMCRKKGVKIGFGTDTGTYYSPHGQQAYEFELMQKYGNFSVTESLVAATKTNAQLLRWWNKVGSVEEGKLADIVAFDGDPYEDISSMCRCTFVMKDGKVYKE